MPAFVFDAVTADPDRLYEIAREELDRRKTPGMEFGWEKEWAKTGGFFSEQETFRALVVKFPHSPYGGEWRIFALQHGSNFYVSYRHLFANSDVVIEHEIHQARETVEDTVIARSVKAAIKRLLQEVEGDDQAEIADPSEAFQVS